MTAIVPISHTRGDTFIRNLILNDSETGIPLDLTGSSIVFSIKEKISDVTPITQVHPSTIGAIEGKVSLIIDKTVTATYDLKNYYYDVQFTDSVGETFTLLKGVFSVTYDITT